MSDDSASQDPELLRRLLRAKDRMDADRVPACFVSAAHRPDLTIAVSEKRRRKATDINGSEPKEIP
jgi:hypothetical protein